MKKNIPLSMLSLLMICILSSCMQDSAPPIRNIKFDPTIINRLGSADNSSCTNYVYHYNDRQKSLGAVNTKQLLVSFDKRLTPHAQNELLADYGFKNGLGQPLRTTSALLYTLMLQDGFNCKQVEYMISELAKDPGIAYVAPYFIVDGSSQLVGISNEIIVTLNDAASKDLIERFAAESGTKLLQTVGDNTFLLQVDKNSAGTALELANALKELPGVAHAEPDFVSAPGRSAF